jgi:TolB-like protein
MPARRAGLASLALRWAPLLCLLLAACTGWRQPPVAPALQQELDRLYTQGASALARNDVDGAITAWRGYTRIAPAPLAQARKLRGYLTLLDREAARRLAQRAAASERAGVRTGTDRLHLAVFPFGSPGGTPFNRAVMAMVMVDLARVPSLKVLEREKIELLLQEQRLAASALVDPATLNAQARLLGAGTVVAGSVINEPGPAGPGSGRYKINTAVSDVGQGRVVGTQEADGRQAEFFVLQKRVVRGILDTLQIRDIPSAVDQVHTRSWAAYVQFAEGLRLLSEDRFDAARQAFSAALAFDPAFALAQEAFLNTPEQGMNLQRMRAEVGAGS